MKVSLGMTGHKFRMNQSCPQARTDEYGPRRPKYGRPRGVRMGCTMSLRVIKDLWCRDRRRQVSGGLDRFIRHHRSCWHSQYICMPFLQKSFLVHVIIGETKLCVGGEMVLRLLIRQTTTSFSPFVSSNIDIFI